MWRSLTFVGSAVALAVAASSREGAAAYSLPNATEMRAWLPGAGGDGESSESATLLVMGVALIGAAWVVRRRTRTS